WSVTGVQTCALPILIRVGQVLALSPPGQAGVVPSGVVTAPLVTTPSIAPSNDTRALITTQGHGNTPTFKSEPRAMKFPSAGQALARLEHAPLPPASSPAPASPPSSPTAAPVAPATTPGSTNIANATP